MASVILGAKQNPVYYEQIKEIFWETSARTNFANQLEKDEFESRYLGIYLESHPEHVLVALDGERVLGYILGATHTLGEEAILKANPHLEVFSDMFERYPAHLHINFRAEARGMGLGSKLIGAFEEHLSRLSVEGLHLITAPTARNVSFYLKNGFSHRVERLWNGKPLLLLGKTLKA